MTEGLLLHLHIKARVEQRLDDFARLKVAFNGECGVLSFDIGAANAADRGDRFLDGVGALAAAVVNAGHLKLLNRCFPRLYWLELDLVVVQLAVKAGVGQSVNRLLSRVVVVGGNLDRLGGLIRLELHAGHVLERRIDGPQALATAQVCIGNGDLCLGSSRATQQQQTGNPQERDNPTHSNSPLVSPNCDYPRYLLAPKG